MQTDDTTKSIFDDDDADVVYLSADNCDDMLSRFAKPYDFPAEAGRPRERFMVRMAEVGTLQKYLRLSKKNNDREEFKALCELIADAVVDHQTSEPIWTTDSVERLARANVPRFNRMASAVLDRNDLRKMPALTEDAEKN